MSGKKLILVALIGIVLIGAVVAGVFWNLDHYVMVDWTLYPKDAKVLDLRQQRISVRSYEKLVQSLPGCEIHWNVPFQGSAYPEDVESLTITTLPEADLQALRYLKNLKTIHAEGCRDYDQLKQLMAQRPELTVEYTVAFSDGSVWPQDTRELAVSTVAEADIHLLQYLPQLERVTVTGTSLDNVAAFCGTAHNLGLAFAVRIGQEEILDTETTLELTGLTMEEAPLLQTLGLLEQLHLKEPEMTGAELRQLREQYPHVQISWEVDVFGTILRDDVVEVDLSQVEVMDLSQVEAAMERLPRVQKLILGLCGFDKAEWGNSKAKNIAACPIANEDVAAFRDRVREKYKVAWTVRLGPDIALRTDVDNFMTSHFGIGRLFTDHAYNLRYCEDMVTLDIGHMTLQNIDFVAFMPKLKYLILAWTEVQSIEPIRSCKELVFLELDNSCVRDFSPLVDCTALEDLNIGNTGPKVDPILEMTWLKNLYMVKCGGGSVYKATQALPDTNVVNGGTITVGLGWRKLQNYYDMRDNLGAPYMKG